MPVPEKIKIKIGDTEHELSVKDNPELLNLVQEGRSEEKAKLNSRIDSTKKANELLAQQVAEGSVTKAEADQKFAKLEKEYNDAKAKLEKLEKGESNDDNGKPNQGGMKAEEIQKMIDAAVTKAGADSQAKIQELEGKLGNKVVGDYREELLAANKGKLIPEFLTGSTKEELDASLKTALEKSKQYLTVEVDGKKLTLAEQEAAAKKATDDAEAKKRADDAAALRTAPDPAKKTTEDGPSLLSRVKDMSPAEYAENREAIKAAAKQQSSAGQK